MLTYRLETIQRISGLSKSNFPMCPSTGLCLNPQQSAKPSSKDFSPRCFSFTSSYQQRSGKNENFNASYQFYLIKPSPATICQSSFDLLLNSISRKYSIILNWNLNCLSSSRHYRGIIKPPSVPNIIESTRVNMEFIELRLQTQRRITFP